MKGGPDVTPTTRCLYASGTSRVAQTTLGAVFSGATPTTAVGMAVVMAGGVAVAVDVAVGVAGTPGVATATTPMMLAPGDGGMMMRRTGTRPGWPSRQ